ncbi:hypothetical protein [Archaeoglobus sulfaticallidus]|uniref:hypothetical protein n=1 Tax=Archaeoglobus sulfaticallidus TaxID=1316941 RepID=UPI0014616301|nr:hypothetical protein [Archaeoglobus sulfaticallidus]
MFRQLKVIKLLKDICEEKFHEDVVVEQYGFSIVISPRNVSEIKDVVRELAKKERFVIEWERREREPERMELERELEYEGP